MYTSPASILFVRSFPQFPRENSWILLRVCLWPGFGVSAGKLSFRARQATLITHTHTHSSRSFIRLDEHGFPPRGGNSRTVISRLGARWGPVTSNRQTIISRGGTRRRSSAETSLLEFCHFRRSASSLTRHSALISIHVHVYICIYILSGSGFNSYADNRVRTSNITPLIAISRVRCMKGLLDEARVDERKKKKISCVCVERTFISLQETSFLTTRIKRRSHVAV